MWSENIDFIQPWWRAIHICEEMTLLSTHSQANATSDWEILYTQEISALQTKKSNKTQLKYRIPLLTSPNTLLNPIFTMSLSEKRANERRKSTFLLQRARHFVHLMAKWKKQRHCMLRNRNMSACLGSETQWFISVVHLKNIECFYSHVEEPFVRKGGPRDIINGPQSGLGVSFFTCTPSIYREPSIVGSFKTSVL